jgi:cell division protein FtsL
MFHQILRRLPGPQILVALPYGVVLAATVVAISHQHRDLGAQLGQFERT